MASEKRTRLEIFLPVRTDTTDYRAVTEWLWEELALARGGSTLTTPFAGLHGSALSGTFTRDQIQILFRDLDLDVEDPVHKTNRVTYIEGLRPCSWNFFVKRIFGLSIIRSLEFDDC